MRNTGVQTRRSSLKVYSSSSPDNKKQVKFNEEERKSTIAKFVSKRDSKFNKNNESKENMLDQKCADVSFKFSISKYKYSKLNECLTNFEQGTEDSFNFYAVIIDATYPHRALNGKSETYTCTFKIVDPYQRISNDDILESYTLVFFANKFEDLPIS